MFCCRCRSAAKYFHSRYDTSLRQLAAAFRTTKSSAQNLVKKSSTMRRSKKSQPVKVKKHIAARRKKVKATISTLYNKTAPAVQRALENTAHSCSAATIRRDLRADGARCLARQKGPLQHLQKPKERVAFAKQLIKHPVQCYFGDGKIYDLSERGARSEWIYPGGNRRCRCTGHTIAINTFLIIGPNNFKFLKILPTAAECKKMKPHGKWWEMARKPKNPNEKRGKKRLEFSQLKRSQRQRRGVDAEIVIDAVFEKLRNTRGFTTKYPLLLDNWRGQTSAEFQNYLEHRGFKTLKLPCYSPDLNVVELGHSWIEQDMWSEGPIKNEAELRQRVMASFERLEPEKLIRQFLPRLQECVRVHGATISSDYKLKHPRW